jgi:hypothetical protein
MVSQRRITQIIAADGWLAVYNLGSGDVSDIRTRPLVCWALIEDAAGSHVVGLDADTAAGDRAPGLFLGMSRRERAWSDSGNSPMRRCRTRTGRREQPTMAGPHSICVRRTA